MDSSDSRIVPHTACNRPNSIDGENGILQVASVHSAAVQTGVVFTEPNHNSGIRAQSAIVADHSAIANTAARVAVLPNFVLANAGECDLSRVNGAASASVCNGNTTVCNDNLPRTTRMSSPVI